MKIAIINFGGNVGKTGVARQLRALRLKFRLRRLSMENLSTAHAVSVPNEDSPRKTRIETIQKRAIPANQQLVRLEETREIKPIQTQTTSGTR